MTFTPLVSIIIPIYNGYDFLRFSLESSINQSYNNLEIIIVDDGSDNPERIYEIANSISSDVIVIHKKNGGVSSALNTGLRQMSGDFFIWLSHDDVLDKDFVINAVNSIKDFDVIVQDTRHINQAGIIIKLQSFITSQRYKRILRNKNNLLMMILSGKVSLNGCAMMIRKKVLDVHEGFPEEYRYIQDYVLWLEMLLNERTFKFLDRVGTFNRMHFMQQSHNKQLLETETTLFFINSDYLLIGDKKFSELEIYSAIASYSNRINNVFLRKLYLSKIFKIDMLFAITHQFRLALIRLTINVYSKFRGRI
jgi:glycosyltransferase involved in cell wall biosynthesis